MAGKVVAMSPSHPFLRLLRAPLASAWLLLFAIAPLAAIAQPKPAPDPAPGDWVSRKEYDQLKADNEALKHRLDQIEQRLAQPPPVAVQPATPAPGVGKPLPAPPAVTAEDLDAIEKEMHDVRDQMRANKLGSETFVLAGDAAFGFAAARNSPSSFSASFSPLALWKPTDRLIFEAAVDLGISNDAQGNESTSVDLTIAQGTYLVNDYLAVGGGLFLAPFGVYHRHYDPPWINKLPDDPLPFGDAAIAPNNIVGAFAGGGVPIAGMKLEYDVYVSNSPNLNTTDPGNAGSLNFHSYSDLKSEKAVGGRIGLQPIPEIDLGYSIQVGRGNPQGFSHVGYMVQGVDAAYRKEMEAIYGTLDVHGEWVWSHVDKAKFDPDGSLGFGPLTFGNARSGGYVLIAYRPTRVSNKIVRDLEFIARYDVLILPLRAPGGDHEQRYTLGVDYWLTPSAVVKFAYEFDHRLITPSQDAFLFQFGIGL